MATSEDSNQQIRRKLIELYKGDKETNNAKACVTLVMFFNSEVNKEEHQNYVSPFNQTLKLALEMNNDVFFKEYTDRMIPDAEEMLKKDPNVHAEMVKIYNLFTKPDSAQQFLDKDFYLAENLDKKTVEQSGGLGLLSGVREVLKNVPETEVRRFIGAVLTVSKPFVSDYTALSWVDEAVSVFSKTGGTVVLVGLAAVFLTWECYSNMRKWWADEISGKRCPKNCIDSFSQIAAGAVGGYYTGAVVGSIFPVVGTVVGGMIGGLVCGWSAKVFSDAITRNIFDLTKDEALENAFNYLKVHHTASNNVINKSFHQMCLKHHPDKGGKREDFLMLQLHMATIKISRESVQRPKSTKMLQIKDS